MRQQFGVTAGDRGDAATDLVREDAHVNTLGPRSPMRASPIGVTWPRSSDRRFALASVDAVAQYGSRAS